MAIAVSESPARAVLLTIAGTPTCTAVAVDKEPIGAARTPLLRGSPSRARKAGVDIHVHGEEVMPR
jgi:hypothetical protein